MRNQNKQGYCSGRRKILSSEFNLFCELYVLIGLQEQTTLSRPHITAPLFNLTHWAKNSRRNARPLQTKRKGYLQQWKREGTDKLILWLLNNWGPVLTATNLDCNVLTVISISLTGKLQSGNSVLFRCVSQIPVLLRVQWRSGSIQREIIL